MSTTFEIMRWSEIPRPRRFLAQLDAASDALWPAYLNQGDFITLYETLFRRYPQHQYAMIDTAANTLAVNLFSVPLHFTEPYDRLPEIGWDWAIREGLAQADAKDMPRNALCVLEMTVDPRFQGRLLSKRMLKHVFNDAREQGFERIFGPARPNDKVHHQEVDIDDYLGWQTETGKMYDSWLRFHVMMSGRPHGPCRRSMTVEAPLRKWEKWTGETYPASGLYPLDRGLAQLRVDVERRIGTYVEPNVWMIYG